MPGQWNRMKNMSESEHMLNTLKSMRDEIEAEVPNDLLSRVFEIERERQFEESRSRAQSEVREAVEDWLSKQDE